MIDWPPTVSVPVRATPVLFAAMLNVTEPMPDPLAPAVIVIQLSGLVAVQEQDVPDVTLSVRLVLSGSIEKLVGVTLTVQPPVPCETVTGWPATVKVAVRRAPGFAATLNVTEPMPDPLAPAVIVIQLTGLVAVQGQDVPVVTLSVRLVLSESIEKLVGVTVAAQPVAACETVTVWPATVSVPVRGLPVVFCAMENVTEPIPEPVAPLVMAIQLVAVVAVHEQEVPAMMLSVRLLAVESTAKLTGVTVPVQPPVP